MQFVHGPAFAARQVLRRTGQEDHVVAVLVPLDTEVPADVLGQAAVFDAAADTHVDLVVLGIEVGVVLDVRIVDVDRVAERRGHSTRRQ